VSAVEFAPDRGDLRAAPAVARWFADGAEGDPPEADALAAAGALGPDGLHPLLAQLRDAIRGAGVEFRLERGGREARGWLALSAAVLVHPLPEDRARIMLLPPALLVDALLRLTDVGPRPHPDPGMNVATTPAELAQALAARDAGALRDAEPAGREAFRTLVDGLREHWRVAARWEPVEGAAPGRVLEVLDSDAGYWIVVPNDGQVQLWPSTPTDVFRALCGLFPLTSEIAAWPS
jgi:hypothetical protein